MHSEVEIFYDRQKSLIDYLTGTGELTIIQDIQQGLQRNLPLAAASYFEHKITQALHDFVRKKSNDCVEICNFLVKNAIDRRYHQFFDWDKNNINKFLSSFGEGFKRDVNQEIDVNEELKSGMKFFLQLGEMRNSIIHGNYTAFTSDVSSSDIYEKFKIADKFVLFLIAKIDAV